MHVVALSVSLPKEVRDGKRLVETGIFKTPVAGRVRLTRLNFDGDGQSDRVNHGGVDKAVYAYPAEHYPLWIAELGADLPHGQFGENLTVAGLNEDTVHLGDRFRIGEVTLEATQPRIPCYKLGIRMGSAAFPKRFLASERSGFYLRVVTEGTVAAGDPIARTRTDPAAPSIRATQRLIFAESHDAAWQEAVRQTMANPGLSEGWREWFGDKLAGRA